MKKKKDTGLPFLTYEKNLNKLIEISKTIDEENEYPPETKNNNIFIKLLFQDIRKCSVWFNKESFKPIKGAIHNCYKLIKNGYNPENQRDLKTNILILERLITFSNPKKSIYDKMSEEVVQNIFDKTLKRITTEEEDLLDSIINNKNENNLNKISNESTNEKCNKNENYKCNKKYKEDEKSVKNNENKDNIISGNYVSKEYLELKLNEQNKKQGEIIDQMNAKITFLEKQISTLINGGLNVFKNLKNSYDGINDNK